MSWWQSCYSAHARLPRKSAKRVNDEDCCGFPAWCPTVQLQGSQSFTLFAYMCMGCFIYSVLGIYGKPCSISILKATVNLSIHIWFPFHFFFLYVVVLYVGGVLYAPKHFILDTFPTHFQIHPHSSEALKTWKPNTKRYPYAVQQHSFLLPLFVQFSFI